MKLIPGCTIAARPSRGRPSRRAVFERYSEGNWVIVKFEGETRETEIPEENITISLAHQAAND